MHVAEPSSEDVDRAQRQEPVIRRLVSEKEDELEEGRAERKIEKRAAPHSRNMRYRDHVLSGDEGWDIGFLRNPEEVTLRWRKRTSEGEDCRGWNGCAHRRR